MAWLFLYSIPQLVSQWNTISFPLTNNFRIARNISLIYKNVIVWHIFSHNVTYKILTLNIIFFYNEWCCYCRLSLLPVHLSVYLLVWWSFCLLFFCYNSISDRLTVWWTNKFTRKLCSKKKDQSSKPVVSRPCRRFPVPGRPPARSASRRRLTSGRTPTQLNKAGLYIVHFDNPNASNAMINLFPQQT